MRLEDKALSFVINFLLGVSWAASIVGAVTTFFSYYSDSFFFAVISAVFASIPGLIGVLLLEHFIVSREKLDLLKTQTELLQKVLSEKKE